MVIATSLAAGTVSSLVANFDRDPAYAGLASELRVLIGDGRLPLGAKLPSERDLSVAMSVSRTTVTRAYAELVDTGYAQARRGAGTFTQLPGGPLRAQDRALMPGVGAPGTIDLNCAAGSAPSRIAEAYQHAVDQLPAYLSGHGYFPAGLPQLQSAVAERFTDRGVATDPEQILITPGALAGVAIVAAAFAAPGERVLIENPVYPNVMRSFRAGGARLVAHSVGDGWDLDAIANALVRTRPAMSYVIPDFQNPTGHVMTNDQRAQFAEHLSRTRTIAVVDEAHADLALEGQQLPKPFAAFTTTAITVGSVSKSMWGGLRVGWIRAPHDQVERLIDARVGLDLGVPLVEQLAVCHLLGQHTQILAEQQTRLRTQRDALVGAVTEQLPEWGFTAPAGGLSLWCRLPGEGTDPGARELVSAAAQRGTILAPGSTFAVDGGFGRHVRLPWTRSADELVDAVGRIAGAWREVTSLGSRPRSQRALTARTL